MNLETKREVKTREKEGAEQVTTNVTFDWTGMSSEDVQALAEAGLTVKVQGGWRKHGIPAGDVTIKVADHKVGVRAPRGPVDPFKAAQALSPEDTAELIRRLQERLANG